MHIDLRRITAAVSLLAGIVEGSDDAIIAKQLDGTIISWNPAAEHMFGYAEDDAIGKHVSMLIPESHRGEDDEVFERILAGRKVEHYETQRLTSDGALVEVAVTVSALRDGDGSIVGASKILRDVSLTREAARAQQRLAAIVEGSDDAIIAKDRDGTISSWNPAAERLFGYDADEAIGRHISMLFPPDLIGSERDILGEIIAGQKVDHYETRRITKDGTTLEVSLTVSPLRDAAGEVIGASKIVRDVSERKRSELRERRAAKLALANEQLAEADRAKDHFLAMANHELRTPLTSIAGFTSTLLDRWDELDPVQHREFLEIIDSQCGRLTRLVEDLMTLSRLNVDRAGARPSPVELAARATTLLHEQGRDDVRVFGDDDIRAVVDPDHFAQMILNYVDNATKYGRAPIEVTVASTGESAVVTVRDHGGGVPEDLDGRLFDRFGRGQEAAQAGVPGTGLGLSIVRGLARTHGGDAWYQPADGGGSLFCVRLPLAREDQSTVTEAAAARAGAASLPS